jgi:acyl-CoA thioester hydrolase
VSAAGERAAGRRTAADADADAAAPAAFTWSVDVRFRDLDAMGHAHHSLVLIYIEEARAAWWREVTGSDAVAAIDYVMAEITLRFQRRIFYPDRITVDVRTARVGRSSFDLEYELRAADGALVATAQTRQVMYDYERAASKPIPDVLRRRLRP